MYFITISQYASHRCNEILFGINQYLFEEIEIKHWDFLLLALKYHFKLVIAFKYMSDPDLSRIQSSSKLCSDTPCNAKKLVNLSS